MQHRTLGNTGVRVSPLCMGTMTFGREADGPTSAALFHRARDAGINFFDCANVYAGGESERILGQLIAGCRDEVVITSKACMPVGQDVNARGSSRRHLRQAVEASLKRLNTDRIDVYFLHHVDPHTPMERTLRAMDDIVREGKVVYAGVSNWAAWQIARGLGICERDSLAPFDVIQPMYNLVKRQAEVEILPLAEAENLGVTTYSPLGGGLLSGKYAGGAKPAEARLTTQKNYARRYGEDSYFDVAEAFAAEARRQEVQPAALAIAWVMHHRAVTAPIIGARNMSQLESALEALAIDMDDETRGRLSALSPTPPPATDRLEEQAAGSTG